MKKNTVTGFMLLALALGTGFAAQAQTPEQRAEIVKNYDYEKINALKTELKKKNEENYKLALDLAAANGWPLRIVEEGGQVSILKGVMDGKPLYISTFNDGNQGSAFTSRVTAIRPGGSLGLNLTGDGMTVGMWEIGSTRINHVDLTGRVTVGDNAFFSSHDEETDHATHVAGTIMGTGVFNSNARGIAYDADLIAFNADNDDVEALDAATDPETALLVSNHSYGFKYSLIIDAFPWMPGAYSSEAVVWDNVTYNAPYYLPVISAGNDRNGNEMKDLLIGNKVSKNVMVVAAVQSLPFPAGYVNKNSVIMSDFSSYGPADDKRIKPDISAKGVGVVSASSESTMAYATKQGTSMAAPGVAGALILLQQHYNNVKDSFMRSATLKALVINTADEAGANDGPDYKFGWGLINAEKAADLITKEGLESIIQEDVLSPGETITFQVTALGTRPIKATLCWTDPAGQNNDNMANDPQPDLRNNLDIKISKTGEADHLPWRLANIVQNAAIRGVNNVDNVEKIEINEPSGIYTVTISHQDNLFGFADQPFSLVIDGVDGELGVSDNELNGKIGVFPNPATDVVNIVFDAALGTDNCAIALYDLQGRLVKQFNSFVDKIDVSGLSSGMYLLNIEKDGAAASKKIMVE